MCVARRTCGSSISSLHGLSDWNLMAFQRKSLPSWRSTSGRCSVSHTVLVLHQWYPYHCIKEGLKHTTCRRPGNLECVLAHHHCNLQDQESISGLNKWALVGPRDKYQQKNPKTKQNKKIKKPTNQTNKKPQTNKQQQQQQKPALSSPFPPQRNR